MPGWIDMHVHVGETSPTEYIDEFTLTMQTFNATGFAKTTLMAGLQRYAI
jgi:dihydroorotase-like cyclic amidohydrolase